MRSCLCHATSVAHSSATFRRLGRLHTPPGVPMELRAYGAVLKRHARLIGLITLATLIVSVGLALRGPAVYTASMRLAVSVVPDPRTGDFFKYDSYYSVLTSEYLADDLSELLRSEA